MSAMLSVKVRRVATALGISGHRLAQLVVDLEATDPAQRREIAGVQLQGLVDESGEVPELLDGFAVLLARRGHEISLEELSPGFRRPEPAAAAPPEAESTE